MKRKLLLTGSIFLTTLSLTGQTIVNGNCESALVPIPGLTGNNSSEGWIGFEMRGENTNPHSGAQAYYVETTNDPTLAAALGISSGIVPGIALNSYKGAMVAPQNVTVGFWYMYTSVNGDYATIEVNVIDTMNTGSSDDIKMYQGSFTASSSVSTWTNGTISLLPTGNTGTPNRFDIVMVSSSAGTITAGTPSEGSKLWFDDVTLNTVSSAGLSSQQLTSFASYPNPVTDKLSLTINDNFTSMEIMSADGKIIYHQDGLFPTMTIDFSAYTKGSYFLKLKKENGDSVYKNI